MCGRYALRRLDYTREEFEALRLPAFEEFDEHPIIPRFDIRPSQSVLTVRLNAEGEQTASMLSWGLMPSWAKADTKARPFNARAEAIATNGMFRKAFERRRCLIPVDGFFEWQGVKPPKQKFFIHRPDDGLFAFAGLWERWRSDEAAAPLDTCTIITTVPNALMKPLHNRMPVILHSKDFARWLDREVPGKDVQELLCPYTGELKAYPVPSRVDNDTKYDGPKLIERIG